MLMIRRYLAPLAATLAILSLVPGCSTNKGPTPVASDEPGNAEPDLLQKLHERMAEGAHAEKPKPNETPTAVAGDSSKASGAAAAAAASGVAIDPVKQQQALAVAADYAQAMALANDGKDDQALALLKQIAIKVPNFAGPLVNQAVILLKQQHYADAEKLLRQALVVNDHNAYAYNELGMTLRQEGKFQDARAAYLSALDIDPNYAKAHFNLGVLADLYLQDLPLAITHYQAYQSLQAKSDKTVANWIVDLQKRTGTYQPPPKPAPVAAAATAASGDTGTATSTVGSGAAAAASGPPSAPHSTAPTDASPAATNPGIPATGGKS
jgi:Flp pilus assembly protein TadD